MLTPPSHLTFSHKYKEISKYFIIKIFCEWLLSGVALYVWALLERSKRWFSSNLFVMWPTDVFVKRCMQSWVNLPACHIWIRGAKMCKSYLDPCQMTMFPWYWSVLTRPSWAVPQTLLSWPAGRFHSIRELAYVKVAAHHPAHSGWNMIVDHLLGPKREGATQ